MRRLIAIVIIMIMFSILAVSYTVYAINETPTEIVPSFESRQYSNVYKLYEYWEENGYPDYVGDVYSTDGGIDNLTILLVNDDGTYEDKIRASLIDDSGVSFGSAKYSHNELKSIQEEIVRNYMGSDKNVYGVGAGWTSVDGIVTGFGEEGNESRVVVGVDKSVIKEYTNIFNNLYGDRVVVEVSGPMVLDGDETPKNNSWMTLLFIFVILICGIFIIQIKRIQGVRNEEK